MRLNELISSNEQIFYRGKPNYKGTILESIFNPMLPFALIWLVFDSTLFGTMFMSDGFANSGMLGFILVFMLLHLMPVWMYLAGIIGSVIRYKNTEYIVTDKGVYISGGMFSYAYEVKPFTDLAHISIHRGIIDQIVGTGDVILECGHYSTSNAMSYSSSKSHHGHGMNISNIEDYERVFKMIQEMQESIYADTMFPNDLRPTQNHGYNTAYMPPRR